MPLGNVQFGHTYYQTKPHLFGGTVVVDINDRALGSRNVHLTCACGAAAFFSVASCVLSASADSEVYLVHQANHELCAQYAAEDG